MTKAYAAWHKKSDWIPLGSVGASPEYVEKWINATYVSGKTRAEYKIVKISIRVLVK